MRSNKFLAVGVALCALAVTPLATARADTAADAQRIGADAYVYGIPLMEFLRTAREQTSVNVPDEKSNAPVNSFGSARRLADAANQVIVQPNNDTLYTMGHLNLRRQPIVLHVPRVPGGRYYTIEFIDPYTNVFDYVGTRVSGDGPGNYVITGPRWHGHLPAGLHRVRSAFDRVWLAGRTLVNGPADLPAVHRVQDGFKLIPLRAFVRSGLGWRAPRPRHLVRTVTKAVEPTGLAFFDRLGDALAANPPPAADAPILRELASVGIGPGRHPSQENLAPEVLAGLTAAAAAGPASIYRLRLQIATPSVIAHHGWFVAPPDIGAFGTDYNLRAVVAVFGLAANRPVEAMYPIGATDTGLALLSSASRYVLHFAPGGLPPARYFWSLTMYDTRFFLVPNPINRYEIGNRTAGLVRGADGSLDIYIQNTPPVGHERNWLPSPASGGFQVTMRLYGPGPSALNDTYSYPAITKLG
ncbi:MAG: DUF1254 domain-containing protein [Solirubrobacteraceae bacterium]